MLIQELHVSDLTVHTCRLMEAVAKLRRKRAPLLVVRLASSNEILPRTKLDDLDVSVKTCCVNPRL